MSKRTIVILAIIWMIILVAGVTTALTLALSGTTGALLVGRLASGQEIVVTDAEYKAINRYQRLNEVLELIEKEYYTETDEDELILGAIRGMVGSLDDPYSYYRTPEEMTQDQDHETGRYQGVGLQLFVDENNHLMITRVFADSPAEEAGIKPGDRLLTIADFDLAEADNIAQTAKTLLLGEEGTEVSVEIERGGKRLTFSVGHAEVIINRVEYCMIEDGIGYIAIYEFMGDDVAGFSAALDALMNEGAKALVLDLRGNPGGLLSDVVQIADFLLDEGLIVYVENRSGAQESYYSDSDAVGLPMAVLVNGASASASEILAGALQDRGAATIIGETTYGKGIVQSIIPFHEDGAGIHLTTAVYYTPSGRSIHGSGITPDIPVKQGEGDEIMPDILNPARDTQLRCALDYLEGVLQP
ncbi:MAG: S41 family peptidase [Clostridia bacterium]|nr:S41 family peptidase [Clostridia bacterium]